MIESSIDRIDPVLPSKKNFNPLHPRLIEAYNQNRDLAHNEKLCYAPFTQMFFSFQGKVFPCCENRNHLLGSYPEKSISEIWFGSSLHNFKEHINHSDLTLGCDGCKMNIIEKNFDLVVAKNYDNLLINKNKYPTVMEFELANTCNLECAMCVGVFSSSIQKNREERTPLNIPYNSKFVKQLEEFIPHLQSVRFKGGEPFQIKLYYDIWDKIIELKPDLNISITTNGNVLNHKIKSLINQGNFDIVISLESLQKKNYERIRINADYNKMMSNLSYFHKYSELHDKTLRIIVCPIRQNWHELPDFINFCNNLGVKIIFNTVVYPAYLSLWSLNAKKLHEIYNSLSNYNFPENTLIQVQNKNTYKNMLEQISVWHKKAIIRDKEKPVIEAGLKNIQIDKLKERLIHKIKKYINGDENISPANKQRKLEKIILTCNQLFERFPTDMQFKKAMIKMNKEVAIETIIIALEEEAEETIFKRFMGIYKEAL